MKVKLTAFISGVVSLAVLCTTIPAQAVQASDWRAGRIIDDSIFTNSDSMSAADIQNFLNQKVGTGAYGINGQCDTNGVRTSELGGGTRAEYGAAHGNPAPFTCLKDYYEVPKTSPGPGIPANNYGGAPIPSGAKSAAQLIYDAAQTYQISPKVLLVTIQKESAGPLITDDWPFLKQYTYAMGAHCPDSGPGGTANCDSNYAGFSIQILESAALFRYYLDNMSQPWWPYKKPGNNSILYNPNTGCGSSVVNILTQATAALYTYTPYQPNQAALNNMYGLGDGCSAYGNRNFWRMYNDWFGSTLAAPYEWQAENWTISEDNPGMTTGEKFSITLYAKNTGNNPWYNHGSNPIKLATSGPVNRSSSFATSSWPEYNRPAYLTQSVVMPGEVGTFVINMQAPSQPGRYQEYFNLVSENLTFFPDIGFKFDFTVASPSPNLQIISSTIPTTMDTYGQYDATVTVKNLGNFTWYKDGKYPVSLGTYSPPDRQSSFYDSAWPSRIRLTAMNESKVKPGENATFTFKLRAPVAGGNYTENYAVVADNLTFVPVSIRTSIAVRNSYAWQELWHSHSTNSVYMSPGETITITIKAKNTGTATWHNDGDFPVMLGTWAPQRNSQLRTEAWVTPFRPALLTESSVAPGEEGTFTFPVRANVTGTFNERYNLVAEGLTWFNDTGTSVYHIVNGDFRGTLTQNTTSPATSTYSPGSTATVTIKIRNDGNFSWFNSGIYPVRIGTVQPYDHASVFAASGWLAPFRPVAMTETKVDPGGTATFTFSVKMPSTAGTYQDKFALVADNFSFLPSTTFNLSYRVQ